MFIYWGKHRYETKKHQEWKPVWQRMIYYEQIQDIDVNDA